MVAREDGHYGAINLGSPIDKDEADKPEHLFTVHLTILSGSLSYV